MNWSGFRTYSTVLGGIMGILLGATLLSFGSGTWLSAVVPTLILFSVVLHVMVMRGWNRTIAEAAAQRSQLIATGQVPGEPAPARVHAVLGQRVERPGTMLAPGTPEPAQLLLLRVLPAAAPPRTVYAAVPLRYGIPRGAAAAVVLDPESPDLAVLDDRVSTETLVAIAGDQRWLTTRVPGLFARQGGAATIGAAVGGLVLSLVIGAVLG